MADKNVNAGRNSLMHHGVHVIISTILHNVYMTRNICDIFFYFQVIIMFKPFLHLE